MNQEAQEIFDRLIKTNPSELNQDDLEFLHARRDYLTDDQLRIYGDVIKNYGTNVQPKPEAPLYISKKDRKA